MDPQEAWTPKDIGRGALLLGGGTLVMLYAYLALANGFPFVFWLPGGVLGPLVAAIGAHAVYRGIRSRGNDEART